MHLQSSGNWLASVRSRVTPERDQSDCTGAWPLKDELERLAVHLAKHERRHELVALRRCGKSQMTRDDIMGSEELPS
jgi:hypothetical protein